MKYKRDLILYKGYFKDFYDALPFEVEKKTDYDKKTQKTPSKQIKQARKIMNEYFKEKKGH